MLIAFFIQLQINMPRSIINQPRLATIEADVATNTTTASTALGTTTSLTFGTGRTTLYSDDYVSILWDGSSGQYQPFFQLTALWVNSESYVNAGQLLVQDGSSP